MGRRRSPKEVAGKGRKNRGQKGERERE